SAARFPLITCTGSSLRTRRTRTLTRFPLLDALPILRGPPHAGGGLRPRPADGGHRAAAPRLGARVGRRALATDRLHRVVSPIGREEAAEQAARELLRPQYARESFIDRMLRYFNEFVGDLLDLAAGGGSAGGIVAAVLILLLLLTVAAVIYWQVRPGRRRRAAGPGELSGTRPPAAAEPRAGA